MEKIQIESIGILGIAVRTTNENGQSARDIYNLWSRFMSEGVLRKIPNKVDDTVYCIYTDYEKDYTKPYTTILGCRVSTVSAIPAEMVYKEIPAGTYARYTCVGNVQDAVFVAWKEIWASALNRKYTADFEVYGEKARNPENAEVDILVAIK